MQQTYHLKNNNYQQITTCLALEQQKGKSHRVVQFNCDDDSSAMKWIKQESTNKNFQGAFHISRTKVLATLPSLYFFGTVNQLLQPLISQPSKIRLEHSQNPAPFFISILRQPSLAANWLLFSELETLSPLPLKRELIQS